jgi:hypothetical protein
MLKSPNILDSKNQLGLRMMKSQEIISHKQIPKINCNNIYLNNKMHISLCNSYLSLNNSETKDFSVNNKSISKDNININKLFPFNYRPAYINKNLTANQNIKNSYSDLCTNCSFSSLKSSESFIYNNNTSQFNPNNSVNLILTPNNNNINESVKEGKNILNFNNNDNKIENHSAKELNNIINNIKINFKNGINDFRFYPNEKGTKTEVKNYRYDNNIFNNKKNSKNNYFNSEFLEQNNKINDEKMTISSSHNSKKNSINCFEKNLSDINNNLEIKSRKKSKIYYNKFNNSKENFLNENTIILTVKIKVGKNDIRSFNLKKYDDLFVSLEKFVNINKINQELVKPLVTKIFKTLNKIFWLINNKIGIYDQEYLGSLYRLWIKNNKQIPKSNKNQSDKSTNDSSNESNDNSPEKIKSNSFQNTDENNDEKDSKHKTKTI